jgi:serine/threonine protein phosphatase PrpC
MKWPAAVAAWLRPVPVVAPRVPAGLAFRSVSRSHVGKVRTVNEDRILDCAAAGIWAIVDGMGGHAAGDAAAEAAVDALRLSIGEGQIELSDVEAALAKTNATLRQNLKTGAPMSGATIAVLVHAGSAMTILWAGDCRVYRRRGGRFDQLTRDHSVVQSLIDSGLLQPDEAIHHPHAHVVTRALGASDQFVLDRIETDFQDDDIFLLCSDGLPNFPAMLSEIVRAGADDLPTCADRLIGHGLDAGGTDNISVLLVGSG